jgi:diguanylate cyclase
VPSELVELSLSRHPDARRAEALLKLADRLLALMAEHAPDDVQAKTETFRSKVEEWRGELAAELDPDKLARLAKRIVAEVDAFLDKTRHYRADREAEFIDLIRVLRDVLDTVRGDSQQFENDLLQSTQAIERMVQIEDIRELKRALAREVGMLKRAVEQRKEAEAAQYEKLLGRVNTLEEGLTRARAEAATDALTGVPNRGAFDVTLREWIAGASRGGAGFSLAMVDLDDFKKVNDTHGHPVGDRVLLAAAQLLAKGVGPDELASRYGGEEFAMLLHANASQARERLTGLLHRIAPAYEYVVEGEKKFLTFTFSAGVTEFVAGDTPDTLIKRADEAMYDAKRKGKKRVEVRGRSLLRALIG